MKRNDVIQKITDILNNEVLTDENKIEIVEILQDVYDYFENEVYLCLISENEALQKRVKSITEQFSKLEKML